ncbi:MAG: hypothetical protein ABIP69_02055, partial [Ferruginibacter sp.]
MKNSIILLLLAGVMASCSKKTNPTKEEVKTETVVSKPKVVKIKTPTPSAIVVNDAAAKKAVDGRLYYDLDGKRYWKNFKDGKYYLYNKSMH